MTALVAVVLARPLDSYPPLPREGEIMRAVIGSCACACGGAVIRLAGEGVSDAVERHAADPRHQWWRAVMEAQS